MNIWRSLVRLLYRTHQHALDGLSSESALPLPSADDSLCFVHIYSLPRAGTVTTAGRRAVRKQSVLMGNEPFLTRLVALYARRSRSPFPLSALRPLMSLAKSRGASTAPFRSFAFHRSRFASSQLPLSSLFRFFFHRSYSKTRRELQDTGRRPRHPSATQTTPS
jgi:hypothetical protein